MSETNEVLAELQRAETSDCGNAEILTKQGQDDGSTIVTVRYDAPQDADMCRADETGDEQDTTADKSEFTWGAPDDADTDCTGEQDESDGLYTVKGQEYTANELRSRVSDECDHWPGQKPEDLAEALRTARSGSEKGEQQSDTETTKNVKEDTENGWATRSNLEDSNVSEEHIEDVIEHAENGRSQCALSGCSYANNGDTAYCASHDSDSQPLDRKASDTASNAELVKQIKEMYEEVSELEAQEIKTRVANGEAESVPVAKRQIVD